MRKVSVYKCPICRKAYKSLPGWGHHLDLEHPDTIPVDYSYARYFYYIQTGKTKGSCIVCKKDTEWNEQLGKYNRYCKDPKCKQVYSDLMKQRMINKYGVATLLNDPDHQRKMLSNRKISGSYKFKDGTSCDYVGSYEKHFLEMLDIFIGIGGNDIVSPSPHTYYYEYDGETHFYIPDFYIPTINLEIEIKDSLNQHHKIIAVDRIKEVEKDKVMYNNNCINYIKIVNKDYTKFFEFVLSYKENASINSEDPIRISTNKPKPVQESAIEYCNNPDMCTSEDIQNHTNVSAIILNANHELLVLDHVKFGAWSLPMGKAKPGQNIEKALYAEMKEELGIRLKKFNSVYNTSIRHFVKNTEFVVDYHLFYIEDYEGTLINNEPLKARSLKWVGLDKLESLEKTKSLSMVMNIIPELQDKISKPLINKMVDIEIDPAIEATVSKVDKDYKPGEKINIDKFKCVEIDSKLFNEYSNYNDDFKNFLNPIDTMSKGYLYFYENEPVAFYIVDASTHTIKSFYVNPKYRNHLIGTQILQDSIKKVYADNIVINTENHIMKEMLLSNNFTIYKATDKRFYLKLPGSKIQNRFAMESLSLSDERTIEYLNKVGIDNIWLGTDWHLLSPMNSINTFPDAKCISDQISTVTDSSPFIYLGDLSYIGMTETDQLRKLLKQLKGLKILIKGNHDDKSIAYYESCGFGIVCDKLLWDRFIFSHIPENLSRYYVDNPDSMNIHGHIHGSMEYYNIDNKNHLDIFAACQHYNRACITLKEALEYYETIYKHETKTTMIPESSIPNYDEIDIISESLSGNYESVLKSIETLLLDI